MKSKSVDLVRVSGLQLKGMDNSRFPNYKLYRKLSNLRIIGVRACLKNSFKQMFVCAFVPRSERNSAWRVIQAA
jgi:hypothetical protein